MAMASDSLQNANATATVIAPTQGKVTLPILKSTPPMDASEDTAPWGGVPSIPNLGVFMPNIKTERPKGVDTDIYMGWTPSGLFVMAICKDPAPRQIRSGRRMRDTPDDGSDLLSVIFDPTNNGQSAFVVEANPDGAKADARITEGVPGVDYAYDMMWESRSYRTAYGYMVKFLIPYSSLGNVSTSWRIRIERAYTRDIAYRMSWPVQDQNQSCGLCQTVVVGGMDEAWAKSGKLSGMAILYAKGQRTDGLPDGVTGKPKTKYDGGVDVRMRTDSMRVDFTYRPDFATIESDVDPLAVNTLFRVLIPEKRPFFQDGMDIFGDSPSQTGSFRQVYTRTILDPLWGAKGFGRDGGVEWGVITARDRSGGNAISVNGGTFADGTQTSDSAIALRYSHGTENPGRVSFIATDRTILGSGPQGEWSRTAGTHLAQGFGSNLWLTGDLVGSWAFLPGGASSALTHKNGFASNISAAYTGKYGKIYGYSQAISDTARMDMGFIDLTGYRRNTAGGRLWRRSGGDFGYSDIGISYSDFKNWDGTPLMRYAGLSSDVSYRGTLELWANLRPSGTSWYHGKSFPTNYGEVGIGTYIIPGQVVILNLATGATIDYAMAEPAKMAQSTLSIRGSVGPVVNSIEFASYKLGDRAWGSERLNAERIYIKAEWALPWFSDLFLRGEWQSVRNEGPYSATARLFLESPKEGFLFRWQPNPFAGFYVGYNQMREKFFIDGADGRTDMSNALVNKGLFAKVSYVVSF
jgi:hypothetical protein